MANREEKRQMHDKAKEMLAKYLPQGNARLFGRVVGHINSKGNSTSHRHVLFVIDKQGDGRDWIVNVNLYIHNLLGYRMDGTYNITTRDSLQDIAEGVSQKLGYKVDFWSA
jgi:hypothetical protein